MELSGVLHVEVEVKSPAEKFWVALGDGINLFPKEFPKDYKTMQVLAGDGNSPGSIRLIIYGEGILSHFIVNLLPYIVSYSDVTREDPRLSNEYGITFMKRFFFYHNMYKPNILTKESFMFLDGFLIGKIITFSH